MKKGQLQRASSRKRRMSPSLTQSSVSTVSSDSRSPSPLRRQGTPATFLPTGRKYEGNVSDESDAAIPSENTVGQGDYCISPGVRYITETLIKKLSKQENLACVTSLNLSLAKDGGKKFKYIENLAKCEKLEFLNLSNNVIEKIEKLDKLLKLRELNLSNNKIRKVESIEHLHNLQKLNLAGNEIEHIPAWMGKKLRSLRVLNLKQNKISSLHEVSKLKSLKDLTSLFLADNPVVNLSHYCLYTIFHLRSLKDLEGQPVTNYDREEALERFNLEEIENLEKELEKTMKDMEDLKNKQSNLLEQLQQQDDVNKSLKQKNLQEKKSNKDLESEVETKNELLKQRTLELTRACQKQYELEQELAFYKIDAKFEPLGYYPVEDVDLDDVPGESPYIGKARYKRNMYAVEGYVPRKAQKMQIGTMEQKQQKIEHLKLNLHQSVDEQLDEKEIKIKAAQERLAELQGEIANAEQHVLKVTEELKQVQNAVDQKKMLEIGKETLRQQLSNKILLLNQLQKSALELEKQTEMQRQDIAQKEEELEDQQSFIDSMDPQDPRHAHMKAQKVSKEQQLDMMNKCYKQLESRLDDMLSQIAKETEEIRDLEQQLTDGQIAANEALKKDLEGIIIGLQEYLESVKSQARQTSDECKGLKKEKKTLLQRLEELEDERNQLEIIAMDSDNLKKEVADLEYALQEQRELNDFLQEAQGEFDTCKAELKVRNSETIQYKEELERLKQLSQLEQSAFQTELNKERQDLEKALTKAQLLEEKEQENNKLFLQLKQLQRDNHVLKQQVKDMQNQLNHAADSLIQPEEVISRMSELKRKLQTGGEIRWHNSKDVLGKCLADLQKHFDEILAHSQQENEAAQARERALKQEMAFEQARLAESQEQYRIACNKAAETKIKSEKRQNENKVRQLESEIQNLSEKLKSMEEIQGLTDQQLQEADEEKERILAQLQDLEKRKKVEDARAQMQFLGVDKELKALKRAITASDKQATAELSATKDQLKSLHGAVRKINQERTEELQKAEKFSMQATQASNDLARADAEIELLQKLLKEREEQFQYEMEKADAEIAASSFQKEDTDKLNQLLKRHKAEIDRLRSALNRADAGSKEEIGSILDELEALKLAISQQNDIIASIIGPLKQKGLLHCTLPSSQASTPGSQSTKDSGVTLQCPMSTPVIKEHRECMQSKKEGPVLPAARRCWVHSPIRSDLQESPSSGGKQEDDKEKVHSIPSFVLPPGSVTYTLLPDGTAAPQGTMVYGPSDPVSGGQLAPNAVIYGSPPAGAQLVYSPISANCSMPLVPVGVIHCSVPEHHNMENEITRLEDIIHQFISQRHEDECPGTSHRERNKEMDELHQNIQDVLSQRGALEQQVAELRRTAQKRSKRKDFVDGHVSGLIVDLELEKSVQHHDDIVEEIECLEKTLLKRRAELREADRLLVAAENELENTRGKTKDTIQKYNSAKQRLYQTDKETEELEQRAQDMAVRLVKADQQLRLLQADAKDLEQHKVEQEGILKQINKVVSAKDTEFQSLSQKIGIVTDSLQKLQADIQVAEGNEGHHLQILKEAENILQSKKTELDRLKDQTAVQQEELLILDSLLSQKREELHLLKETMSQKNADLIEALREAETEVSEKQQQMKDVTFLLEDLSVQKGELNAHLSEKRAQLSLVMQSIRKEEEKLQDVQGQIMKHKTEFKHILEMSQLGNSELEHLKLQHDQKVNELEKMQVSVLEEKLKWENLQQASQQQRAEAEHQQQLLERAQEETVHLKSQLHSLQKNIKALSHEKQLLEENCQSLEEKLSQTKRTLTSTKDISEAALTSIGKMDLDVRKLQLEIDQLQKQKTSLKGEIADLQKHFNEEKEELNRLKNALNDSRQQLQLLEEGSRNAAKQKEELFQEQAGLRDNISDYSRKYKECQESQREKKNQLQKLCMEIDEQELERDKQAKILQHLREDALHEEKKLEACTAKLKDQKQKLEQELADHHCHLEQVIARVQQAEERMKKLQEEESWCTTLEEAEHQPSEKEIKLHEKVGEVFSLQSELELSKAGQSMLQNQIQAERKIAQKQIAGLRDAIKTQRVQLEKALHEQKHENSCLQKEVASIQQVAHDNHQRAERLTRDLGQFQEEYVQLKSQLKSQEDLEKEQKEIKDIVKRLKLEVKDQIRTGLKDLSHPSPELLEDLETGFEGNGGVQCELESLKENYPFASNETRKLYFDEKLDLSKVHIMDEQWRGKARREQLQHQEDRLKARLRQCMFKQVEVLIKGKQQTEGTLHSLKRQVDALDELVNNTSGDSLLLSFNSSGSTTSPHEDLDLQKNQVTRSLVRVPVGGISESHNTHQYKA